MTNAAQLGQQSLSYSHPHFLELMRPNITPSRHIPRNYVNTIPADNPDFYIARTSAKCIDCIKLSCIYLPQGRVLI